MRVNLKPLRFTVLCEDRAHQRLLRLYLNERGVENGRITFLDLPDGRGSGEQHVREKFQHAVHTHRTRGWENRALLVMVDGDKTPDRKEQLLSRLSAPRTPEERIVILVPRRNLETWLAFFRDGGTVDEEETDYTHHSFSKNDFRKAVQDMVIQCHQSGFSVPSSFLDAVQEWQRLGQ